MIVTLKDQQILDRWGIVLERAAGREDELLKQIESYLLQSELSELHWEKVATAPGILKGLFGKKREYLMVVNKHLKDFRVYVSARSYGIHLDISWFLTVEPGVLKRATSSFITQGEDLCFLSFDIDLHDQQDLRAFVTVVHRYCIKKAIEDLLEKLGEENLNFDWRSLGFLKVW